MNYLAYRTWRSTLLFNVSLVIASLLFGKILTNFVDRRPGFAGFRVQYSLGDELIAVPFHTFADPWTPYPLSHSP